MPITKKITVPWRDAIRPEDKDFYDTIDKFVSILAEVAGRQTDSETMRRVGALLLNPRQLEAPLEKQIKAVERSSPEVVLTAARFLHLLLHLGNTAEVVHISRRRRAHNDEEAIGSLAQLDQDFDAPVFQSTDFKKLLAQLDIGIVLTAHPTEARRRTILNHLNRIGTILNQLDRAIVSEEICSLEEQLFDSLHLLWLTRNQRPQSVTVQDEVSGILFYLEKVLFDASGRFYRRWDRWLNKRLLETPERISPFRIHSWVAGDRDGHPDVKADDLYMAFERQKSSVLKKYREALNKLYDRLSISALDANVDQRFLDLIRANKERTGLPADEGNNEVWGHEWEPFRSWIAWITGCLGATQGTTNGYPVYDTAEAFCSDVTCLSQGLQNSGYEDLARDLVQPLLHQIDSFGFHFAAVDVRESSSTHRNVLDDIFCSTAVCVDYAQKTEAQKQEILLQEIRSPRPLIPSWERLNPETRRNLALFKMIGRIHREFGPEAISSYIISHAEHPSDLLAVFLLAKESGLITKDEKGQIQSRIGIVPLFESGEDLDRAPQVLATLLQIEEWQSFLQGESCQEIMLGYSDSAKSDGLFASNWALFKAQQQLVRLFDEHALSVKFFHGRGGSVSRGGGPSHEAILAQPWDTIRGRIRITEQGEVISAKYEDEDTAVRNIDRLVASVLRHSLREKPIPLTQALLQAMDTAAEKSRIAYQNLINHSEFEQFVQNATPLELIRKLNIGSRPSRRSDKSSLDGLRAIAWVFAWNQNRSIIPGWFGVVEGIQSLNESGASHLLQDLPALHTLLLNVAQVLTKTDSEIFSAYSKQFNSSKEIENRILESLAALRILISEILDAQEVKKNQPVLIRSLEIRLRLLRFLHAVQLVGWQRADDPEWEAAALVALNGISAGLRNTG